MKVSFDERIEVVFWPDGTHIKRDVYFFYHERIHTGKKSTIAGLEIAYAREYSPTNEVILRADFEDPLTEEAGVGLLASHARIEVIKKDDILEFHLVVGEFRTKVSAPAERFKDYFVV
jgi:hypothetical protein